MSARMSWPIRLYDRVVLGHPRLVLLALCLVVAGLAVQGRHLRFEASADTLVMEEDEDLAYARQVYERYGIDDFVVVTYRPAGKLFSQNSLRRLGHLRDELSAMERVAAVRTILDVPLLHYNDPSLKELEPPLPTLGSPDVDPQAAAEELTNSPIYRNLLISPDGDTTALMVTFAPDAAGEELAERREAMLGDRKPRELGARQRGELEQLEKRIERHEERRAELRHEDLETIRAIMDRYRDDARLFLGGVSMIADDMVRFIRHDLRVFGLGGAVVMALTLGALFRRARWIALPMLTCVASAAAVIGVLGWLDWRVTVVSANFIALQLIVTLAIAVHLAVRYRELLRAEPNADNRRLVRETVRLKSRPCTYAVLTTMAGFGSLLLCDILPVVMLGKMMMVGLAISLVVTFLLLPTCLMLLRPEPAPKLTLRHVAVTTALARLTEKRGRAIRVATVLVVLACLIGAARLEVENRFIDYFHNDTEIHQGMLVIDRELGGTTPLDVILRFDEPNDPNAPGSASGEPAGSTEPATPEPGGDEFGDFGKAGDFSEFEEFSEFDRPSDDPTYWFTREKLDRIEAAHDYLDGLGSTGKVLSLASLLDVARPLVEGRRLDSFELAMLFEEVPEEFRRRMVHPFVSVEHDEARISVRVIDSDPALRRDEFLRRIEAELPGAAGMDGSQVRLSGLLVLYNKMLQSLFRSQIVTLGVTAALLAGMLLALFRSARVALVAMVPNLFPVAVVLGVMGWASLPLDLMTMTIAAIGIGIAVDNTIHYLYRFRAEFATGGSYLEAMHRCHGSIGRAMYYTSATITLGLTVLALSSFMPTVLFGLLTALALVIALLADLAILPDLVMIVRPFGPESPKAEETT